MSVAEFSELILRAKRREPPAFDTLIERYAPRLFGYFYRVTGRRSDAEDLLQELFVRLVSTIQQYEDRGRFEAWLFRIATNLVRDRIRRIRAAREVWPESGGAEGAEDAFLHRADPLQAHPSDRLQQAEVLDRLQWALNQLPEPERSVVLLRHFSQMSFREIADMMETPLGTALARSHRGLTRLRELMSADSDGDGGVQRR